MFLFVACSGYGFRGVENPFRNYGINSISIPMFVNKSIIPGVSGPFTAEIFSSLSHFKGLRLYSGENSKADAILIGVLESREHRNEVYNNAVGRRYISDGTALKQSIGARGGYYLNNQSAYVISLRIYLIKDPVWSDVALAKSDFGKYLAKGPKIILSETHAISQGFSRVLNSNLSSDDGGVVNFTNTKGVLDQSILAAAQSAASWFQGVVVSAF